MSKQHKFRKTFLSNTKSRGDFLSFFLQKIIMVYLAYLGKEYGIAKLAVVVLGTVIVYVGLHGYFHSAWVQYEVYKICDLLNTNSDFSLQVDATCPSILLEKVFVIITLLCFSLSTLGLIGNLFSKQLSQGFFKIADIGFNGMAGILVLVGGSLFLSSTVEIDKLFAEIGVKATSCVSDTVGNSTYQLYEEKVAAGSLSIIQGLVYFGVALLLLLR